MTSEGGYRAGIRVGAGLAVSSFTPALRGGRLRRSLEGQAVVDALCSGVLALP